MILRKKSPSPSLPLVAMTATKHSQSNKKKYGCRVKHAQLCAALVLLTLAYESVCPTNSIVPLFFSSNDELPKLPLNTPISINPTILRKGTRLKGHSTDLSFDYLGLFDLNTGLLTKSRHAQRVQRAAPKPVGNEILGAYFIDKEKGAFNGTFNTVAIVTTTNGGWKELRDWIRYHAFIGK